MCVGDFQKNVIVLSHLTLILILKFLTILRIANIQGISTKVVQSKGLFWESNGFRSQTQLLMLYLSTKGLLLN